VSLHRSFITKRRTVSFSRKYQIQLSSCCDAETSLQQSTLDSYSNYKYLEVPGTNYVHFPTNAWGFYAPLPSLSVFPKMSLFPSSHKTQLASCYDTQIQGKRLTEDTGNDCPATTRTLHSQNRLSHCRGTAWVFTLYLTVSSSKGKELNYILVLYSDSLG